MTKTTFLLAGHGSRNRDGNDEIERFADQWRRKHPDWRIEVCFIEHADVLLNDGLDNATAALCENDLVMRALGPDNNVVFVLTHRGELVLEMLNALSEAVDRVWPEAPRKPRAT